MRRHAGGLGWIGHDRGEAIVDQPGREMPGGDFAIRIETGFERAKPPYLRIRRDSLRESLFV